MTDGWQGNRRETATRVRAEADEDDIATGIARLKEYFTALGLS